MTDERSLTPTDVRLLAALAATANVVRAARRLGIARDRAVYRLHRMTRLYGGPVVTASRGGRTGGGSRLSPLGRHLLDRATGSRPGANRWDGRFRRGPPARVDLGGGGALAVAFRAADGRPVSVEVDPDAWVIARRPAELSARNAVRGIVETVRRRADGTATVAVRWGPRTVRATVTAGSLRRLGIARGRPVILYAKAVAVRRVPTRGSLPS